MSFERGICDDGDPDQFNRLPSTITSTTELQAQALAMAEAIQYAIYDDPRMGDDVQALAAIILRHLAPVSAATIRNNALEEAAKVVDVCSCGSGPEFRAMHMRHHALTCRTHLATMIRALRDSLPEPPAQQWMPISGDKLDRIVNQATTEIIDIAKRDKMQVPHRDTMTAIILRHLTQRSIVDPEEVVCVACGKPSWAHSCDRPPLGRKFQPPTAQQCCDCAYHEQPPLPLTNEEKE